MWYCLVLHYLHMEQPGNETERLSLVEQKRVEALGSVLDELEERLRQPMSRNFEAGGRTYEITSAEDCMVAYAQKLREMVQHYHDEVVKNDDYRAEQASAKILALFAAYEKMIDLYAELRSYYPVAASRVEEHLPSLTDSAAHGEKIWSEINHQ